MHTFVLWIFHLYFNFTMFFGFFSLWIWLVCSWCIHSNPIFSFVSPLISPSVFISVFGVLRPDDQPIGEKLPHDALWKTAEARTGDTEINTLWEINRIRRGKEEIMQIYKHPRIKKDIKEETYMADLINHVVSKGNSKSNTKRNKIELFTETKLNKSCKAEVWICNCILFYTFTTA